MSTKNNIKKIIKEDLGSFVDTATGGWDYRDVVPDQVFGKAKDIDKLKTKSVTGDKVAHSAARAEITIDRIKDNLRSMGVNASDLSDQDTIDFYKALKTFPFSFSINKVIKGFFNDESKNIKGKASVDQRSNAKKFVMYFTHIDESEGKKQKRVYRLNFSSKTLQKNLRGTDFDLPMLLANNVYDVRISDKSLSTSDGWDEPKGLPSPQNSDEEKTTGEGGDIESISVPPEIKKNRNEIFRLLLKNYGGFDGDVVYGDGFKTVEEAKEYVKLLRAVKKGEADKSELKTFRDKSSRDSYSMMISNLRKSFPKTFFSKLDKAFPEFNLSFTRSVDESIIYEDVNSDKYKRWKLVFGNVIDNTTIDKLDSNIREFMAAVKKWFSEPIEYRGKKQSYKIDFNGDKVNDYWNKFYGKKNESTISINSLVEELMLEKGGKPPKGTTIGQGERWDDNEKLPKYYDRKLKIISVPNYIDKEKEEEITKSKKSNIKGVMKGHSNSKISNIRGSGAGSWSSGNIQKLLNNEFKSNNVEVKKSMSKDDTLILTYPGIQQKMGTDAVLISKDNISNLFLGNKLKNTTVKIGPKAGGYEEFKEEGEAEITLLPSLKK